MLFYDWRNDLLSKKIKIIVGIALASAFIIGHYSFYLMPIGKTDMGMVYVFNINDEMKAEIKREVSEDRKFKKFIWDNKVTVDEKEINSAVAAYKQTYPNVKDDEAIRRVKKGLFLQKIVDDDKLNQKFQKYMREGV